MLGQQVRDPGPQPIPGDEMLLSSQQPAPLTINDEWQTIGTAVLLPADTLIEGDVVRLTFTGDIENASGNTAEYLMRARIAGILYEFPIAIELDTGTEATVTATGTVNIGSIATPSAAPVRGSLREIIVTSSGADAEPVNEADDIDTTETNYVRVEIISAIADADQTMANIGIVVEKLRLP